MNVKKGSAESQKNGLIRNREQRLLLSGNTLSIVRSLLPVVFFNGQRTTDNSPL